jgi:hypothetical protein
MAEFKPLNLLDLSFVLMETRQTPMHVAGLQTFVPPPDAPLLLLLPCLNAP